MSLPACQTLQFAIVRLLRKQPNQRMHCTEVYATLAEEFPEVTRDEVAVKYRHSRSKFANEVQWARHRLRKTGLLLSPHSAGRGYWQMSTSGSALWPKATICANDLLREIQEGQ